MPLREEVLPSGRFGGIEPLLREFLKRGGEPVGRAVLAIAGPVINGRAAVTNLPWIADAAQLRRTFGWQSVRLLNDLAATARAVPLLRPEELHLLQRGEPAAGGGIAVIAPGTGLGEAFLTWDGTRYREQASEGGHGSFAPADRLEADLLQELWKETAHVSVETLCSGPGIGRIYRFFRGRGLEAPDRLAGRLAGMADPAPIIVEAALAEKDELCLRTIRLFAAILAAEAGNLALKTLSTGGVYLGGGLAIRLLPFLEEPAFLTTFTRKDPMADLLFRMPVQVILEPRAALIGAADCGFAEE